MPLGATGMTPRRILVLTFVAMLVLTLGLAGIGWFEQQRAMDQLFQRSNAEAGQPVTHTQDQIAVDTRLSTTRGLVFHRPRIVWRERR